MGLDPIPMETGFFLSTDGHGRVQWIPFPQSEMEGPLQSRIDTIPVFDTSTGRLLRDTAITIQDDHLKASDISTTKLNATQIIVQDSLTVQKLTSKTIDTQFIESKTGEYESVTIKNLHVTGEFIYDHSRDKNSKRDSDSSTTSSSIFINPLPVLWFF